MIFCNIELTDSVVRALVIYQYNFLLDWISKYSLSAPPYKLYFKVWTEIEPVHVISNNVAFWQV